MGSASQQTDGRQHPLEKARRRCHAAGVSLFNRVVAINAGALVVAALVLALSPATVSSTLTATEVVVLAFGTVSLIAVNIVLLRQVFGPLERLASVMRRVSPEAPGRRLPVEGQVTEVADVCKAFNATLDRLEDERRMSGARALTAQENERRRLARELHDEVGQTLTGRDLPMLAAEQDLAIDRVAQESLTNVARHADAQRADLALQRADGRVVLVVRDDGRGIEDENLHGAGVGMAGMRERALVVGGRLAVQRSGRGGTEVRLDVPVRETS